jgi:formamidopyrimidine-DNA glycosylase
MMDGFTFAYFSDLIDVLVTEKKRSAKSLLTQDQLIPGLGNTMARDILFKARSSPKHNIADLNQEQRETFMRLSSIRWRRSVRRGGGTMRSVYLAIRADMCA